MGFLQRHGSLGLWLFGRNPEAHFFLKPYTYIPKDAKWFLNGANSPSLMSTIGTPWKVLVAYMPTKLGTLGGVNVEVFFFYHHHLSIGSMYIIFNYNLS